jgi:cell wall-associated NlpC family hydrolase
MIEKFVETVRSYVGTPFHWHGRVPGVGLDCSGVLLEAAAACGVVFDFNGKYSRANQMNVIHSVLSQHCKKVTVPKSGDILVMEVASGPGHIMILDGDHVIHASDSPSSYQVERVPFDDFFRSKVAAIYRFQVGS